MNRMERSAAHLLQGSNTERLISSLELMLSATPNSRGMISLLHVIASDYRMTASRLESAEKRLAELESEDAPA